MKTFTNTSIAFALVGQILGAIAQPIITSCPGKIATGWFREDKVYLTI